MRLSRIEDHEKQVVAAHVRNGHLATWTLLAGREGTPENYSLRLAELSDYASPRHRHSFDQVRLQLEGDMDFDKDGKMTPGVVGYFPESVHYGPHATMNGKNLQLVLQFTGPSGANYVSEEAYAAAVGELKQKGKFANGVFTWHDEADVKHNKDGYLAVWEHVYGQKLDFAKPRFQAPVMIKPDAFDWGDSDAGVGIKALAQFPANRVGVEMVKIEAAARFAAQGPALLFARSGEGSVSGKDWSRFSAIELNPGERVSVEARVQAEWLVVHMPWQRPVH